MDTDNKTKWGIFVMVVAAIAANGKDAVMAFAALPDVLQKFATGLPFGVVSFFLALAISVLVWLKLDPGQTGPRDRATVLGMHAETFTFLSGVGLTLGQTLVVWPKPVGAVLQSLMLGILVGLLAPWLGKLGRFAVRKVLP